MAPNVLKTYRRGQNCTQLRSGSGRLTGRLLR